MFRLQWIIFLLLLLYVVFYFWDVVGKHFPIKHRQWRSNFRMLSLVYKTKHNQKMVFGKAKRWILRRALKVSLNVILITSQFAYFVLQIYPMFFFVVEISGPVCCSALYTQYKLKRSAQNHPTAKIFFTFKSFRRLVSKQFRQLFSYESHILLFLNCNLALTNNETNLKQTLKGKAREFFKLLILPRAKRKILKLEKNSVQSGN